MTPTGPSQTSGLWSETDGTLTWTSTDHLRHQATAVGRFLAARGVADADLVVFVSDSRPAVVAVDLAAVELGARVEVISPHCDPADASRLLRTCDPAVVFCQYREQATIAASLCRTTIVTCEDVGSPPLWADILAAAADDHGAPAAGVRGARATQPGEVVVCTADLAHPGVRGEIRQALAEGNTVVLGRPASARRLHGLFDPARVITGTSFLEAARRDVFDRAPRTVTGKNLAGQAPFAVVPAAWAVATAAGWGTSPARAALAMAASLAIVAVLGLRNRGPRRLLVALASAAAAVLALRAADLAPSAVAALELFVAVSLALRVPRQAQRWATSAVWRHGTGPVGAVASPAAAPRARNRWKSVPSWLLELATRRSLGLHSCTRVTVADARPDSAQRYRPLLGQMQVSALPAAERDARAVVAQ